MSSLDQVTFAQTVPLGTDADGTIRVRGTRVTLDAIVSAFREGATAEEIAQQYPSVGLSEAYAIIGFYLQHRPKVDEYLAHRLQRSAQVRRENERRFSPKGVRERLMARRTAK